MIIETLWALRKGEYTPELLAAWDEFTIDQNPQGWEDDKQKATEAIGDDALEFRYIKVEVLETELEDAFKPQRISATVKNEG